MLGTACRKSPSNRLLFNVSLFSFTVSVVSKDGDWNCLSNIIPKFLAQLWDLVELPVPGVPGPRWKGPKTPRTVSKRSGRRADAR